MNRCRVSWDKYKELYLSDSIKTDAGGRIPIRKYDKTEREAMAVFFQTLNDVRGNGGLMEELKDVAFEVLILHYGVDKKGWINILCSQYKTEVVDVYGPDDCAARDGLSELWTTTYTDTAEYHAHLRNGQRCLQQKMMYGIITSKAKSN